MTTRTIAAAWSQAYVKLNRQCVRVEGCVVSAVAVLRARVLSHAGAVLPETVHIDL